jgi:hypothetical protein
MQPDVRRLVVCALALDCALGCGRARDDDALGRRSRALSGEAPPAEDPDETLCERQPPILRISPDTVTVPIGALQLFDLELANASAASCPSDELFAIRRARPTTARRSSSTPTPTSPAGRRGRGTAVAASSRH